MPPWAEGPCSQAWEAQGEPRCLQKAPSLGSLIRPTGPACISREVSMEMVLRETAPPPPPALPGASCVSGQSPARSPEQPFWRRWRQPLPALAYPIPLRRGRAPFGNGRGPSAQPLQGRKAHQAGYLLPCIFRNPCAKPSEKRAHAGARLAPGGPGRLLLQVQAQTCCLYTQTWPKVLKTNCRPRAGCQTRVSSESEWLTYVYVRGVPAAQPRGTGH